MTLDLDPTEQQLAAALGRLATAYVPDAGEPAAPAQRPDHRRWLALAVAASLIALVAGIWAVADRDTDPAVVTVPPTSAPPTTATPTPAPQPLPQQIGVIGPDAAARLGLTPTGWSQREPDSFVDDAAPPTYAIRRDAVPGVATWQVVPSYWWQTSRLGGTAVSLDDGRTAFRSDDGSTVTLAILIDAGVLTATIGVDEEPLLRSWLSGIEPTADATALEPPEGYEVVGVAVAGVAVIHTASAEAAALNPSALGGVFVLTVELDRDATLADLLTARYRTGTFTPLGDDPSTVFDPDVQMLVWQAGPRTFVEVPGTAPDRAAAVAAALTVVPSDSPELVPGVRAFTAPDQIPAASLTRTVLAATPHGRFAYSELDDGAQTCWRILTFLGGNSDCDGSRSQRPICIASRGLDGPWDAMVIVIDAGTADIVVEQDGATVTPEIATGTTADGTTWLVGWVTGIGDGEESFPATITVDGTPCEV